MFLASSLSLSLPLLLSLLPSPPSSYSPSSLLLPSLPSSLTLPPFSLPSSLPSSLPAFLPPFPLLLKLLYHNNKLVHTQTACDKCQISICRKESLFIQKGALIRASNLGYYSASAVVILFVVFTTYVGMGGVLTPKIVFTAISLLTVLRILAIHLFLVCLVYLNESRVATTRITVRSNTLFKFSFSLLEDYNQCSALVY